MKKLLCVISRSPYCDVHTIELLEEAMVAAVFEFEVSVLFRGDGVWALVEGQNAKPLGVRTVGNVLSALPTYEIDSLYVCQPSLKEKALNDRQLVCPVTLLNHSEQTAFFQAFDTVIGMP